MPLADPLLPVFALAPLVGLAFVVALGPEAC